MPFYDELFWQGLIFTGAALGFVAVSTWWLYRSPMKTPLGPVEPPSPRVASWCGVLLALSAAQLVTGAMWDASMHLQTGRVVGGSDFLWPPHIMIYSSFLLSLLVAVIAIGAVAIAQWSAGVRDPRAWLRRSPYLGAVALASVYMLMAIPGDALWHELFGVDLTAWSPPHVLIGVSNATVILCALGMLAQARPRGSQALTVLLLALMLNMAYLIGVLEWELPGSRSPLVNARPVWFYPLVGGALAFFTLLLAKKLVRWRWAATLTALAFYAIRLGISTGLSLTGNIAPLMPLWFILGAALVDGIPWNRFSPAFTRNTGIAAAFTLGYAVLSLPLLSLRTNLSPFTVSDYMWSVASMFAAGLALLPLAQGAGARLTNTRPPLSA